MVGVGVFFTKANNAMGCLDVFTVILLNKHRKTCFNRINTVKRVSRLSENEFKIEAQTSSYNTLLWIKSSCCHSFSFFGSCPHSSKQPVLCEEIKQRRQHVIWVIWLCLDIMAAELPATGIYTLGTHCSGDYGETCACNCSYSGKLGYCTNSSTNLSGIRL